MHEADIRSDGEYFFVWNDEMRWAGTYLCEKGRMTKTAGDKKGHWALAEQVA